LARCYGGEGKWGPQRHRRLGTGAAEVSTATQTAAAADRLASRIVELLFSRPAPQARILSLSLGLRGRASAVDLGSEQAFTEGDGRFP
jgi:hypothetical protein